MFRVLFRRPLPERYGRLSTHTALQCSIPGDGCGPSGMDVLVAYLADHACLVHVGHPAPFRRSAFRIPPGVCVRITCAPWPCGRLSRSSLAGRDPCDYYEHSVAVGLASLSYAMSNCQDLWIKIFMLRGCAPRFLASWPQRQSRWQSRSIRLCPACWPRQSYFSRSGG